MTPRCWKQAGFRSGGACIRAKRLATGPELKMRIAGQVAAELRYDSKIGLRESPRKTVNQNVSPSWGSCAETTKDESDFYCA